MLSVFVPAEPDSARVVPVAVATPFVPMETAEVIAEFVSLASVVAPGAAVIWPS